MRHGESTGNVAAAAAHLAQSEVIDVAQRDADVPLSPGGVDQARALGQALRDLWPENDPPGVWSSPYVRAAQTAQLALEESGRVANFYVDERLRDRELGVLDLLTFQGVAARFPYEAERRRWLGSSTTARRRRIVGRPHPARAHVADGSRPARGRQARPHRLP